MKCAIIGCGRISTNHVTAIERNGFDLVAVCDVLPERMESLLARHGLEAARPMAAADETARRAD